MALNFNNTEYKPYVGNTEISRGYVGNTLVYHNGEKILTFKFERFGFGVTDSRIFQLSPDFLCYYAEKTYSTSDVNCYVLDINDLLNGKKTSTSLVDATVNTEQDNIVVCGAKLGEVFVRNNKKTGYGYILNGTLKKTTSSQPPSGYSQPYTNMIAQTAFKASNGKTYVFGGYNSTSPAAVWEAQFNENGEYTGYTNKVKSNVATAFSRYCNCHIFEDNNKLYVVSPGTNYLTIYDIENNTLTSTAFGKTVLNERVLRVFVYDNKIYFILRYPTNNSTSSTIYTGNFRLYNYTDSILYDINVNAGDDELHYSHYMPFIYKKNPFVYIIDNKIYSDIMDITFNNNDDNPIKKESLLKGIEYHEGFNIYIGCSYTDLYVIYPKTHKIVKVANVRKNIDGIALPMDAVVIKDNYAITKEGILTIEEYE